MYRLQTARTIRALQCDLATVQRSTAAPSREFSLSKTLRSSEDGAKTPPTRSRRVQSQTPPQSDPSMGIGSRTAMRDQRQTVAPQSTTTAAATTENTDSPIKITRLYRDFPAPTSTSHRGNGGNIDARFLGASRPQSNQQRLGLSAADRVRLDANRRSRGAAAATAGSRLRNAARGVGASGAGGGRFNRQRQGRRVAGARADEFGDDEASSPEERRQDEERLQAEMAPPPREWVDHTPEDLSLDDLRVDWPSVPTGSVGMVEEVASKLRWMSRRMQHDYDSPQELALRMHRGEMVHFESDAEREEVLQLARELAEKKAALVTERKGQVVEARDSSFRHLDDRERRALSEEFIQGIYPPVTVGGGANNNNDKTKKHRSHAFLGDVVRILGNNETYHAREQGQLVETIQKLLTPAQQQQQQQK